MDTWEGTSPLDNGCCIEGRCRGFRFRPASQTVRASYPAGEQFVPVHAGREASARWAELWVCMPG